MRKLENEYGKSAGHFPPHDYYRTTRDAFGTSLHVEPEVASNKSAWALGFLVVVLVLLFAVRFYS